MPRLRVSLGPRRGFSASDLAGKQPLPNTRIGRVLKANGGGGWTYDGWTVGIATGTATNGVISPTIRHGQTDLTSGAVSGNQAYISDATMVRSDQRPLFQCEVRLVSVLNLRAYLGWSNQGFTTLLGTATPGAAGYDAAVFRFDVGAGDATWKAVTSNGSADTVTDTGVAPTAGIPQEFDIDYDGTRAFFKINGATVAQNTTTLPRIVNPQYLVRAGVGVQTLEAVAKGIGITYAYVDQD